MILRFLAAFLLLAPAFVAAKAPASAAGVVSSADPRAAEAGESMLRQGGTATDAALATLTALTVVEPQSSGIGGGGFLLHSSPDGTVTSIDGRETAPFAADPARFLGPDGNPRPFGEVVPGGLSVGVPGNVALVDVQLALGSSGLDVSALIQARWTNTLIVFVTGNPKTLPCDFAGAHGVVAKPFSRNGLKSALHYIEEGVAAPPPACRAPDSFKPAPSIIGLWGC